MEHKDPFVQAKETFRKKIGFDQTLGKENKTSV
jgi:hypothetical protein